MFGLKNIFAGRNDKKGIITAAKMEELFEYIRLKNMMAYGLTWKAGWKDKPYQVGNPPKTIPAHIYWKNDPQCAYVAITENGIEYRYGEKGEWPFWNSAVTTDEKHIKLINDLFVSLYTDFKLPDSLKELQQEKATTNTDAHAQNKTSDDKMALLKQYLSASDLPAAFYELVEKDEKQETIMWVDWHDEDDEIIRCFEELLCTGTLSAETKDADNVLGFNVIVSYKGKQHIIPYSGDGADRDTTIITLNEIIAPDYEIRFCKHSNGSDTLAFLPLSSSQWSELGKEYNDKCLNACFGKISKTSKMFGD